jgi:hypothetical protein
MSKTLLWIYTVLVFAVLSACGNASTDKDSVQQAEPEIEKNDEEPVPEEVALDTMTLDNIDPNEIMTDDWSDDGDIEVEVTE